MDCSGPWNFSSLFALPPRLADGARMLQTLSREVRECYQRAEVCARRAQTAFDEETRRDFRALEESWLKLAHSYEFAEQILAFTSESKRKREKWWRPRRPQ
jgi:hypothetical protein